MTDAVLEAVEQDHKYIIRGVAAEQLPRLWKHGEPFVKRALDHANGEIDHHDVLANCQSRDMQLWLIGLNNRVVGAMTTEIVVYPRKKVVRVVTLAGKDFDKWAKQLDEALTQWGQAIGVDGIECYVRSGFTKKLASYGFKKVYEICYRQVI